MGQPGGRVDSDRQGIRGALPAAPACATRCRRSRPSRCRQIDRDWAFAVARERRRQTALGAWLEDEERLRRPGRCDGRRRRGPRRRGPDARGGRRRRPRAARSAAARSRSTVAQPIAATGGSAGTKRPAAASSARHRATVSAIDEVWRMPVGADTVGRLGGHRRPPLTQGDPPVRTSRPSASASCSRSSSRPARAVRGSPSPTRGTFGCGAVRCCAGGTTGAVSIVDFGFEPADLTVAAGTTVTWTNTAPRRTRSSGATARPRAAGLTSGATYQRTFDTAGAFPVRLRHPWLDERDDHGHRVGARPRGPCRPARAAARNHGLTVKRPASTRDGTRMSTTKMSQTPADRPVVPELAPTAWPTPTTR